jgi:outer membrane protein, multidrug efflux system
MIMKSEARIPNSERNQKSKGRTGLAGEALFRFRHSDFFRISEFGIRIFVPALLAFITGCTVGPNYKRPEATTIPAAYTGATNVVATDAGATNGWKVAEPQAQISKGNWWEIFGDAELNELESQASGANQQLKVAVARLAEARAQMNVTRAGLFPNVSLSGSFVRQRDSANAPSTITGNARGRSATFDDFYVPLSLGYELDVLSLPGRRLRPARTISKRSNS